MTDLQDEWTLYWLDGYHIIFYPYDSRAQAVASIEQILNGVHNAVPAPYDAMAASDLESTQLAKRRRVPSRLLQPQHDIGGLALPDDAADVLSPSELIGLQCNHMLTQLHAMPQAASLRPPPSGMYA